MRDYIPTTKEVKETYISALITEGDYWDALPEDEAQDRWDRWLADYTAAVLYEVSLAYEDMLPHEFPGWLKQRLKEWGPDYD